MDKTWWGDGKILLQLARSAPKSTNYSITITNTRQLEIMNTYSSVFDLKQEVYLANLGISDDLVYLTYETFLGYSYFGM